VPTTSSYGGNIGKLDVLSCYRDFWAVIAEGWLPFGNGCGSRLDRMPRNYGTSPLEKAHWFYKTQI